jgi:hypothetical protein
MLVFLFFDFLYLSAAVLFADAFGLIAGCSVTGVLVGSIVEIVRFEGEACLSVCLLIPNSGGSL